MTPETPRLEAIVWDLDETLIHEDAAVDGAFARAGEVAAAGAGVSAGAFAETARRCARTRWHASPAREYCVRIGISSWEGLWGSFDLPEQGPNEGGRDEDAEAARTLRA